MDGKEGAPPPTYSEAASAPTLGGYNAGYAPPPGDQGGAGHPPQGGYGMGYPPQQQYGMAGYGQQPAYNQQPYGFQSQQQQTVVVSQPTAGGMVVNSVQDNMGLAIFTTICCCWPLGLIAIMRAQESRRALERGDFPAASTFSQESRRYSLFAIAGGCISIVIAIIIIVVVVTQNSYYYYNSY